MDLSVTIGGVTFPCFISNAAGTVKTLHQMERIARSVSGAGRGGSYMPEVRAGNRGPRTWWISEDKQTSLNALGIPGPGYEKVREMAPAMADALHKEGKPLVESIAATAPEGFGMMATLLNYGADMLEANMGCPNLWFEGQQKPIISYHPESFRACLQAIEKVIGASRMERVGVKVSPFFFDPVRLVEEAEVEIDALPPHPEVFPQIVEIMIQSGVSHVVAMNTVPRVRKKLADRTWAIHSPDVPEGYGGLAGPVVGSTALEEIRRWREALPDRIVIVGAGGVRADNIEAFLDAGAVAVQVATEFYDRDDPRLFGEIATQYLKNV